MKLVSKAADSFCDGDLVDKTIRTRSAWGLLPTQVRAAFLGAPMRTFNERLRSLSPPRPCSRL